MAAVGLNEKEKPTTGQGVRSNALLIRRY